MKKRRHANDENIMQLEFLKFLRCPYCGKKFEVEMPSENTADIETGLLKCACDKHPIIEGILYIKSTPLKKYLVELVSSGKAEHALYMLLGKGAENIYWFASLMKGTPPPWARSITRIFTSRNAKKYLNPDATFTNLLGNSTTQLYFKHRFSSESLWSFYPFLPMIRKKEGRVLDLGCGMGHASFIIAKHVRPEIQVCADYSFKALYINRKFFTPSAGFICLDANYPLPFDSGIFSTIVMIDALQYITGLSTIAEQMKRVLSPKGMILLSHVRMALAAAQNGERALPSRFYMDLLTGDSNKVKVYPEQSGITREFLLHDKVDLSQEYPEELLDASPAVSILATSDEQAFLPVTGIWNDLLKTKDNLIVNPMYKIEREKDIVHLDISQNLLKILEHEGHLSEQYLPKKVTLGPGLSRIVKNRTVNVEMLEDNELTELEQLMKSFVVINVPEKFL